MVGSGEARDAQRPCSKYPLPRPAIERIAKGDVDIDLRCGERDAAGRAAKGTGACRAADPWLSLAHHDVDIGRTAADAAAAEPGVGHYGCQLARKTVLKIAMTIEMQAYLARIGVQPHSRVLQRHGHIGQTEGGGGLGIAELVQFAQGQDAVMDPAMQAHAACANGSHPRSEAAQRQIDLNPLGSQVGMRGIAKDDILYAVSAQADGGKIVTGADIEAAQFPPDEILSDRRALGPERE